MDENLVSLAADVEEEMFVTALSTHWIKYAFPIFVLLVTMPIGIGLFAVALYVFEDIPLMKEALFSVALFFVLLSHHWFFHRILSEAMEDVIITNKRVIWIQEMLFCCDDMRQVPLNKIQGVEVRKHGLLQTILGYGSVWFDTGGTITHDENATMHLVPHPHRIAKTINQLLNLK